MILGELFISPNVHKASGRQAEHMKFPTAFDTSLGANFAETQCADYFDTFLANSSFAACRPMSFLLTNSRSYFDAIKKGQNVTEQVVDQACSVDKKRCQSVMDDLDRQLMKKCKKDFKEGTQTVQVAHRDFMAYEMVRDATCLRNTNSTNSTASSPKYCYTEALFGKNSTDTADGYLYLLPVGYALPDAAPVNDTNFPDDTRPSCSSCNKRLLDLLHDYSNHSGVDIANLYKEAAKTMNSQCGSQFANPKPLEKTADNGVMGSSLRLPVNLLIVVILLWSSLILI